MKRFLTFQLHNPKSISKEMAVGSTEGGSSKQPSRFARTCLCFTLALFFGAEHAYSQFYYSDFNSNTGPFTTYGTAKYYSTGNQDDATNWWIRLLNNAENELGYAIYDKNLPTDKGLTVEFDFKMYTMAPHSSPNNSGIGLSVFFIDPDQGAFQTITAKGDGLGFTDQWGGSSYLGMGARPTYLGVAFARAGLFAGNMGTTGDRSGTGGIASPPDNNLSLRTGSLSPAKYSYLTNSPACMGAGGNSGPYMNLGGSNQTARPVDGTYYRRFRIDLVPNGTGMRVTVSYKTSLTGAFTTSFTYDYSNLNGSVPTDAYIPRPDKLGIGFSATSGSGTAKSILEIRNIVIRTPGLVWVQKQIPEVIAGNVPITTVISNNGLALSNITVKDTMPSGYKVTATPLVVGGSVSGITNAPTADGRTEYTYTVNADLHSKVTVTWQGKFATTPDVNLLKTSAAIAFSGTDDNANDNYHAINNILIPITHKQTDITFNTQQTIEVMASGSPTSLVWEYSINNGTSWVSGGTGTSFSTTTISGSDVYLLRCIATWSNGDKRTIRWKCQSFPDNVITNPDVCVQTPVPMEFKIREIAGSTGGGRVSPMSTPVVGDIDNDGEVEVIVLNCTSSSTYYPFDSILIYGYRQQPAGLYYKYGISVGNDNAMIFDRIGIAKVDGSDYASIFFAKPNGTLIKYEFKDSLAASITYPSKSSWTAKWTTANLTSGNSWHSAVSPYIVDLYGNGRTQVIHNDKVIDTHTGNILVDGKMIPGANGYDMLHTFGRFGHRDAGANGSFQSVPVIVDIDNDGIKEIVSGCNVYGVTLVNFSSTSTLNKFFLKKKAIAPKGRYEIREGGTAVADLDLDGQLEVIVAGPVENEGELLGRNFCCGTSAMLYVWDPRTGEVLNTNQIARNAGLVREGGWSGPSRPFAGDVDGDGLPEIVLTSNLKLHCFKYDTASHQLTRKWPDLATNDKSSSTTITMFDFAHDGKQRLVYRDEETMRIIDASGATPVSTTFPAVYSLTGNEYPVVADINGDGAAEIIVTGSKNTVNRNQGQVLVYASDGQPWAAARKVWNQSSYNALNVNDDLTIPSKSISPAHAFHAVSPTTGNDTILRPFNGFLMQQGTLRPDGTKVWITPDAVVGTYTVAYNTNDITVTLNITNNGDAALVSPVHIAAYKNSVSTGNKLVNVQLDETIQPGQTKQKVITVNTTSLALTDLIIFRINDRGEAKYVQLECSYGNNNFTVRRVLGADDTQTVQSWQHVTIDVLANDGYTTANLTGINLIDSILVQPKNGKLVSTGSGVNSKLIYTNEGTHKLSATVPIDSFQYRIWPSGIGMVLSPWVYIYILQDEGGSNNCPGRDYIAKLKALPTTPSPPTTFNWYATQSSTPALTTGSATHTIADGAFQNNWFTIWVEPVNVGNSNARWNLAGGFPRGEFKVHASSADEQMQWTGHMDNNWHNPANWVLLRNRSEQPVSFIPGLCTDVIIPSNVNNFPELGVDTARCKHISMLDRAMLSNPHVLKYTTASVEIKLKPAERDRFLMWSAPLKHTYSGDYHYRPNGIPAWGDVFMNFFQLQNPDYNSTPQPSRFTSTFADSVRPLTIGTAFNLKVLTTSVTRDSLLRFPRSDKYGVPTLPRDSSSRFITDNYTQTTYDMPVTGGTLNSPLVQVVNPYMAYLNISPFLSANPNLKSGYYMWDGEVGTDVNAFARTIGDDNNRIVANGNVTLVTNPDIIPPLQSFFVAKQTPSDQINTLKMSREWTTTKPVGSYILRSSVKSGGVLTVSLSGNGKQAGASLVYHPGASNFATDKMDMPAVTYAIDGSVPLSVYTVSSDMIPLAINASSTFDMLPLTLGIIASNAGEYTLRFDGLQTFGHDVTLTDMTLNKRITLSSIDDEYKFTLAKATSAADLNNRFKLNFAYTGKGIVVPTEDPTVDAPIRVTSGDKYIDVTTRHPLSVLQVYNSTGRTVYISQNTPSGKIEIPVVAGGIYMVRAVREGNITVTKILVK